MHTEPWLALLALVACGGATLVHASLIEWLVHRLGYHEPRVWERGSRTHALHHDVRYPASRFFERGRVYLTSQPFWIEAAYLVAHVPVGWALWRVGPPYALVFAAVLGTYGTLAHYVHPLTHLRTGRAYERTRLFKSLVARHVRHHQDTRINFNLLLPIGDLLFGTFEAAGRRRIRRPGTSRNGGVGVSAGPRSSFAG